MSEVSCTACQELREAAPEFVTSGVTDTVCGSLAANTGLDASNGHDDATDLHLANDCYIGRMKDEVNAYDVCDWKPFMKRFIGNLYEMLKAIICSLRGIWNKLMLHDTKIAELEESGAQDFCEATNGILDLQLEVVHGVKKTAVFPTDADLSMAANTITVKFCDHQCVADLVTIFASTPGEVTNLKIGDVLFTVEKSDLVPRLMHNGTFEGIMTYGFMKQMFIVEGKWAVYGLLHSHDDYPGKLVCTVFAIVGPTQIATGHVATTQSAPSIFTISRS